MNRNQFLQIKTERLLLRKPKTTDWEMVSYLRSDKEINKYVKRPSAESKEKALEFITKINNGISNNDLLYWAITEQNNDQMIGSICLWNFSADRKTAEVGYDLSPKSQGKGMMNESLKGVLEFGFVNLKLDLIEAYTHQKNEPSKKMLERNGFELLVDKKDIDNQDNVVYQIRKS